MNFILIIGAVFLVIGIVQLFINFSTSLLVTILCTIVVAYFYIKTDRQCKQQAEQKKELSDDGNLEISETEYEKADEQDGEEQNNE